MGRIRARTHDQTDYESLDNPRTTSRNGDACVLWCLAIRHAVLTGVLDGRIGLQHIGADRQQLWARRLDAAEKSQPSDFRNNGWVVEALQGGVVGDHDHACPAR